MLIISIEFQQFSQNVALNRLHTTVNQHHAVECASRTPSQCCFLLKEQPNRTSTATTKPLNSQ